MSDTPHFLSSEIPNGPAANSPFHIIPAPLEKTVSYHGGDSQGPGAILQASDELETLACGHEAAKLGIHTQPEVDPSLDSAAFLAQLQGRVQKALKTGAFPLTLGGEHSLSFAPIAACAAHSTESIGVIQIDAHCDLRQAYQGNPYSHASVMYRVVEELGLPVWQLGTRAYAREEAQYRDEKEIQFLDAAQLYHLGKGALPLPKSFPKKVYLSVDVDGFDPSVFPSTGTPVPGGIGWHQGMEYLEKIFHHFEVVGADVVELAPNPAQPYADFAAAQLVYNLISLKAKDSP
jgi:agmatinase